MDGRGRLYQQITQWASHTRDRRAREHAPGGFRGSVFGAQRSALWATRVLALAVVSAGLGFGLVHGGHVTSGEQIADRLGRLAGLEIKRIKVDGSRHLSQAQLIDI